MFVHGKPYRDLDETAPRFAFDVSSHGRDVHTVKSASRSERIEIYWNTFSPFNTTCTLYHPCFPEQRVVSVEACWQGSKFVDPLKREDIWEGVERWKKGTKPEKGVCIGDDAFTDEVGLGRRLVYVPVYTAFFWQLMTKHKEWLRVLRWMAQRDREYELYDFDANGDLDDPKPLSHAAVLVNILNSLL